MNKLITDLKADVEVTAPHVLQAINAVMSDISRAGISKDRNNAQQGYKFRGIDDVYNALAPILSRNHLVITPKCLNRSKEVVQTAKGGTLFYVTVDMQFEFASAIDGSTKTAQMFGEAMDSGDKATNKAMSAAYKYMAMQEFCIPTEGDNDADAQTHEVAAPKQAPRRVEPQAPTLTERADRFAATLKAVKTPDELKKAYGLGGKLFDDLERSDPERRVELAMLYEARRDQLSAEVSQ